MEEAIIRENYASAKEHMDKVKGHVLKDVEKGWMVEASRAEAEGRYGDELQVASLGAVPKDKRWADVRVVHDGTHGLKVNTRLSQPNRMAFPQFDDLECAMRALKEHDSGARFLMAFDIKSAHRLIPVHRRDWGLQACRLEEGEKIYLNTRGTFGVASAAFWWGRLAGLIFRTFHKVIPVEAILYLLLVADDGLLMVGGAECHRLIIGLFLYLEVMEVPLSWAKTRGGSEVEWIGYTVDLNTWRLGVGPKKVEWLKTWCSWAVSQGRMLGRDFKGGLGRLGFLAGISKRSRPFLAPLYAASSQVKGGSFFNLHLATKLAIQFFEDAIVEAPMKPLSDTPKVLGEVFRVDAMADGDGVAMGGSETFVTSNPKEARWFHLKLDRSTAPFLYVKGEPFRTISTTELLAATVAVMVFCPGGGWHKGAGRVAITGFTDNMSNSYLLDRFLTTKFPACLILMELSKQLDKYGLDLNLTWIPREQNEESDDLSKQRFDKFDPNHRVQVNFAELDFLILRKMLNAAMELDSEIKEKKTSKEKALSRFGNKIPPEEKLRLTQPW